MTNKLEIHGLDLTGMGIGDVPEFDRLTDPNNGMWRSAEGYVAEELVRQILGSITFGPVQFVDLPDPEDIDDDEDWEYAE